MNLGPRAPGLANRLGRFGFWSYPIRSGKLQKNAGHSKYFLLLVVNLEPQNVRRVVDQSDWPDSVKHFIPDPGHDNALPMPLRQCIHDLETRSDPAGDVAAIACLREHSGSER